MRIIILFLCIFLIAQPAFSNTDSLLNKLDKELLKKDFYTKAKIQKIEKLKANLRKSRASVNNYYTYLKIYEVYKTLNFDSAFTYANKIHAEALRLNDAQKINRAKINLSFVLLSSGMFKETLESVDGVNVAILNDQEKIEFYILKARCYYDLSDFNKNKFYTSKYLPLGNQLADSTLTLTVPNSYNYLFVSGLKNLRNGESDKALKNYLQILKEPNLTDHQFAIVASTLSFLYQQQTIKIKSGNFLDRQKALKTKSVDLLIEAAMADIRSSTKENVAIFKLADTLFKAGDNERAYRYIREAMTDAEFYGARHRQFEVGTLLPIIEGKQLSLVEKQKNLIITYAAVVTLLILIIIAFIVVVIRQNKKLKAAKVTITEANAILQQTNLALTDANMALREVNRIKDEYIGYYFNINSDYIDKIDRFKRSVSQRLTLGRYDDIKQIIDKIDLKKEREDLSMSFDKVFIKLFPHFVNDFNALFEKADQVHLAPNQILNAELRIFALIRLGIHDNDKIAKILNFSVNTIYSYKTRIKNKSFIANEEFEDKIMEIKGE
jgi:hypothetical protein